MTEKYKIQNFPKSRLATIDICAIGKQKHHVTGVIELDVTESRKKIKEYNSAREAKISFTAWLISVIGATLKQHEVACSFRQGKSKIIIFDSIDVSLAVEKVMGEAKIPIPLLIRKANEASMEHIARQIDDARSQPLTREDIVLQQKNQRLERLYFLLPGFLRRRFWRYLLNHPKFAFRKMGNVAFTSLGMIGRVNGWFIPISVHPICFGVGSVIKKPVVALDSIVIREILNMTILIDHDIIDGAPMARLIANLTKNIETGMKL
jgi:pyruvate/2-oxoglutarate dehydrogenase complex dihydrolipoamide acyltransferase (E2) component